jgi:heptosyltransferase-2
VALQPPSFAKVLVRATNWLGDAVMSLPAIRAIRDALPEAHIALVARPWVADLYAREDSLSRVIPYPKPASLRQRLHFAAALRQERFDAAIL